MTDDRSPWPRRIGFGLLVVVLLFGGGLAARGPIAARAVASQWASFRQCLVGTTDRSASGAMRFLELQLPPDAGPASPEDRPLRCNPYLEEVRERLQAWGYDEDDDRFGPLLTKSRVLVEWDEPMLPHIIGEPPLIDELFEAAEGAGVPSVEASDSVSNPGVPPRVLTAKDLTPMGRGMDWVNVTQGEPLLALWPNPNDEDDIPPLVCSFRAGPPVEGRCRPVETRLGNLARVQPLAQGLSGVAIWDFLASSRRETEEGAVYRYVWPPSLVTPFDKPVAEEGVLLPSNAVVALYTYPSPPDLIRRWPDGTSSTTSVPQLEGGRVGQVGDVIIHHPSGDDAPLRAVTLSSDGEPSEAVELIPSYPSLIDHPVRVCRWGSGAVVVAADEVLRTFFHVDGAWNDGPTLDSLTGHELEKSSVMHCGAEGVTMAWRAEGQVHTLHCDRSRCRPWSTGWGPGRDDDSERVRDIHLVPLASGELLVAWLVENHPPLSGLMWSVRMRRGSPEEIAGIPDRVVIGDQNHLGLERLYTGFSAFPVGDEVVLALHGDEHLYGVRVDPAGEPHPLPIEPW